MKAPKTKTPDDASAAGEEQTPQPQASAPKAKLAELQAIFAKREEKLQRLRDLEARKAKYRQEIEDLKIDPLAEDAEALTNIRRSRESMIEMIDLDIWKIHDTPDPDLPRAKILINDLANCVQEALDREIPLLCEEIREFMREHPIGSFLLNNDETFLADQKLRSFPCFFRLDQLSSQARSFVLFWTTWDDERLTEEAPRFLDLVGRAVAGERFLVLPQA
jgi:hypothetical protein